jgi:hypothetical protein
MALVSELRSAPLGSSKPNPDMDILFIIGNSDPAGNQCACIGNPSMFYAGVGPFGGRFEGRFGSAERKPEFGNLGAKSGLAIAPLHLRPTASLNARPCSLTANALGMSPANPLMGDYVSPGWSGRRPCSE